MLLAFGQDGVLSQRGEEGVARGGGRALELERQVGRAGLRGRAGRDRENIYESKQENEKVGRNPKNDCIRMLIHRDPKI